MGGGGGSSGKVSWPNYMQLSHEGLLDTMEGYVSSVPDPKYFLAVAYDPAPNLTTMDTRLSEFNTAKTTTYAPVMTLSRVAPSAVTVDFDATKLYYELEMLGTNDLQIDMWTTADDEAIVIPTPADITVDTWASLPEGVPGDWTNPSTDPISNVNIQGIFNATYNAALVRKTFEEQTNLKGRARNMGTAATSGFLMALAGLEKVALVEATQAVTEYIKHQMTLMEARTKEKNDYQLAVAQAHRELRKLQSEVMNTAVAANKTKNETLIATSDLSIRKRSLKNEVANRTSTMILEAHKANIATAEFWLHLNSKAADVDLQEAELNIKLSAMTDDFNLKVWDGANRCRLSMLSYCEAYLKNGVAIEQAKITANIDEIDHDLQYDYVAREWVFKKLGYWGQALSAMSGGGAGQGLSKPSQAKSALTGALSGAAMGASTGNPYAAAAGAVIGGVAGYMN